MSAQHTPGPWAALPWRRHSPTTIVKQVNGVHVMTIADLQGDGFDPETLANARLIAAAPELLALCKAVLAHPGFRQCDCGKPDCATTRLHAVIAKAEGAP